jgi:glycosyltransferase involved in cell wall biosynthesis
MMTDQQIMDVAHPRVAAIIPAYNEAGRVGKVVQVVCQVQRLDEIIVVDDGSRDASADDARQAASGDERLRIITHATNLGKGQALLSGWRATQATYVVLLDADLINLRPDHIIALMEPVLTGRVDMTMGLFHKGYWRADAAHWMTPWLTGQRCLRAALVEQLSPQAAAGYGFETSLTLAAHRGAWRIQRVPLYGVTHPMGELPRGGWHGPQQKFQMWAHILRAWYLTENWNNLLPRLLRRARLVIILLLALAIGWINNFNGLISSDKGHWVLRLLSDDTLLQWLDKLRATFYSFP